MEKQCKYCNKIFNVKTKHQVYCSNNCSKLYHREIYHKNKEANIPIKNICSICNKTFYYKYKKSYCSAECQKNKYKKIKKIDYWWDKEKSKKKTRGYYVYVWFKDNEPFPFYIGKGIGKRAWEVHRNKDNNIITLAQRVRENCETRIEIIKDGLTEEGAFLLESCLIEFIKKCGWILTNQNDGMIRPVKGVLELNTLLSDSEQSTLR